ncbi:oxysterol-binding protein-related protein 6-like isoform X2 [Neocloeon triangulifer]|uniref:oxysterol-binding protein-related protein 6-like isoform X2 n=1 Tax=Neocloeon triangulifer TaxID=2078957 RepID=UPI00286F75E2|nr:oxysterol-binding protein-related protein 6-like isoform X2 [Neocloeon triangulifer]
MSSGLRHIATEPASLNSYKSKAMADKKNKSAKSSAGHNSDSDGSADSNSLSADSNNDTFVRVPSKEATANGSKAVVRRASEWEILEGLKDGQRFDKKPKTWEGYLHKKRKWPLKGWHKRYFVVDKGILIYAKGPGEIARGKHHASLDIGLSVISSKLKRRRIDIDAEEFIYHLKAKTLDTFQDWVEQLKLHRLYRQHVLTFGTRNLLQSRVSPDLSPLKPMPLTPEVEETPPQPPPASATTSQQSHSRVATWIMDSTGIDSISKELTLVQQNLVQLNLILEQIEQLPTSYDHPESIEGSSPNVKKDRRKFGLRKKKSSKGSAADLVGCSPNKHTEADLPVASGLSHSAHLSNSNPSLPSAVLTATRPQSLPGAEHLLSLNMVGDNRTNTTPDFHCREDFVILAKEIHINLKEAVQTMLVERDRLKQAMELDSSQMAFASTLHQNKELKNRLNKIHENSDLSDVSSIAQSEQAAKQLQQSLSYSSSCLSASEFFDAQEFQSTALMISETSSEASLSSEEGSVVSENSELGTDNTPAPSVQGDDDDKEMPKFHTGRRTKLPAPRPDLEGLSLWNLLCKNIGKDLSKVSMPVALNEPLSMLQRLCEELEYSELLDKAAELEDPFERMVCIAAFAVSGYGSSYYRAASKPFNPILGETYECIREDKGFRFVAEQVSHHPPVSVCHAESKNFIFWQDVRIKTKFWGKSMEFQPTGTVNLKLPGKGDHYQWNKVTTCVHNVFGGQRWVDQYGELVITSNKNIKCKLTFVRSSYWSAKKHEIYGNIINADGKVARTLFGKWNEALYCGVAPSAKCIWRPGTMPEDYELYYGFTRFAMELNEIDGEMIKYLPCTDTRFRPDQRLLEEGNLTLAENMKMQLEQAQRERRKRQDAENVPRWFRCYTSSNNEEIWEYNDLYWVKRKNPGFVNLNIPALW